jgi:hypothetical protein
LIEIRPTEVYIKVLNGREVLIVVVDQVINHPLDVHAVLEAFDASDMIARFAGLFSSREADDKSISLVTSNTLVKQDDKAQLITQAGPIDFDAICSFQFPASMWLAERRVLFSQFSSLPVF